MRATRRVYAVALGAASLVLVGSMAGAVAYASNNGPSGTNPWSPGNGMMGQGWSQSDSADEASVTMEQATKIASDWVSANLPGATIDAGTQMPMGYVFVASKDGKVVAHVMVNDDNGKVYAVNAASVGGMMGGGWANGNGTGNGMMGQGWSNGRGQMMGQGRRPGSVTMTLATAQSRADEWLAANEPGATATAGTLRPMGYVFTVTDGGATIGRLMVFDQGGQVVFHAYTATPSGGTA
jgi:hypothetical protein